MFAISLSVEATQLQLLIVLKKASYDRPTALNLKTRIPFTFTFHPFNNF